MNVSVPLSKLASGRLNPRRVKPEQDAHRRLVASIRAYGLLEPLIVQAADDGRFRVIAGNRRLSALREVYRGEDRKVACITKSVDADTAAAMSLAENFAREPMSPLDEASAFARLASKDRKGVAVIAEEFGVSDTYVRQRMKLAGLASPVKDALQRGDIPVSVAEAFAAVPTDRQVELWDETGGHPRHAQHIRNLIEHEWITARHALFDVAAIPAEQVSHDLFGGETLIHRPAFIQAQRDAMEAERQGREEEGWKEAVVAEPDQVRDRLYAMEEAEREYDAGTSAKLRRLRERREKWESKEVKTERAERRVSEAVAALQERERALLAEQPGTFGEAVKAAGTAFLILYADGRVERHYRVARGKSRGGDNEHEGRRSIDGAEGGDALPTSDEVSPNQLADLYTQQALGIREVVVKDRVVRKRLIVLALHEKVRTDALAVRPGTNATTLRASQPGGEEPPLWSSQQARRRDLDPLSAGQSYDEVNAYELIKAVPEKQLDAMIAVLVGEIVTGHLHRPTPLIAALAEELDVNIRRQWLPDAAWLKGYQKAQLADLIGKLKGSVYGSGAMSRKKSELVDELAALFSQANATPGAFDPEMAERINAWLPAIELDCVCDAD